MVVAALAIWMRRWRSAASISMSTTRRTATSSRSRCRCWRSPALFQIADGVQAIAAGALRGYRDTAVPMVLAAIGYWGIGFAGGWALAFPLGQGAVGLWWGLALGLLVVSSLLTVRVWACARSAERGIIAPAPVAHGLPAPTGLSAG